MCEFIKPLLSIGVDKNLLPLPTSLVEAASNNRLPTPAELAELTKFQYDTNLALGANWHEGKDPCLSDVFGLKELVHDTIKCLEADALARKPPTVSAILACCGLTEANEAAYRRLVQERINHISTNTKRTAKAVLALHGPDSKQFIAARHKMVVQDPNRDGMIVGKLTSFREELGIEYVDAIIAKQFKKAELYLENAHLLKSERDSWDESDFNEVDDLEAGIIIIDEDDDDIDPDADGSILDT